MAGVETSSGTDFSAGAIQQTGRSLDVAIEGDAFLQIQTAARHALHASRKFQSRCKRSARDQKRRFGCRRRRRDHRSARRDQHRHGRQFIGQRKSFRQIAACQIRQSRCRFDKRRRMLFLPQTARKNPQADANSKVVQGALESSNVNSLTEMVAMINNNREFESLQKNVSLLMNDLGRKIAGEIGKI